MSFGFHFAQQNLKRKHKTKHKNYESFLVVNELISVLKRLFFLTKELQYWFRQSSYI